MICDRVMEEMMDLRGWHVVRKSAIGVALHYRQVFVFTDLLCTEVVTFGRFYKRRHNSEGYVRLSPTCISESSNQTHAYYFRRTLCSLGYLTKPTQTSSMASFVVVVDTSARRLKVKTNPEKSLSEVLQEACTGWRYDPSLYTLK